MTATSSRLPILPNSMKGMIMANAPFNNPPPGGGPRVFARAVTDWAIAFIQLAFWIVLCAAGLAGGVLGLRAVWWAYQRGLEALTGV